MNRKKIIIIFGVILGVLILTILIDGALTRFFDTKPLIAKKEEISYKNDTKVLGVVYRTMFADVYYCNEISLKSEERVVRYYHKKGDEFTCKGNDSTDIDNNNDKISSEIAKLEGMDYVKAYARELYNKKLDSLYGINNKLGVMIYNFVGHGIDEEYQDVYMFDINNFDKEPVKLLIEGFDMPWRSSNYKSSKSGNILAFSYSCGYKDIYVGTQKYSMDECNNNKKTSGIYVFRVNGINDFEQLAFYPEERNIYLSEYPDSSLYIGEVSNDEELIIVNNVSKNKQESPDKIISIKWNFITDESEEISNYSFK